MKTYLNKAFYKIVLFLFFLFSYVAHAVPEPCDGTVLHPCDDGQIPTNPTEQAPIDENSILILIIAVLFGIYIIYNHKLNKKRPI